MDIEQLRLILETLNNAGDGAFTLAIVWMVVRPLVIALGFGGTLYLIARCVVTTISSAHGSEKGFKLLRSRLSIGSSGYLSSYEREQIIQKVFELKEKEESGEL